MDIPSKLIFQLIIIIITIIFSYVPDLEGDDWKKFCIEGKIEGSCCGPTKETYGGKPGKGLGECGSLMYNEAQAAGFETFYDENTASTIVINYFFFFKFKRLDP